MTKHSDIRVPEGYFQDLQQRLQAIPEQQAQSPRGIVRIAPYFAYAASIAILALVGSFIIRRTAIDPSQEETIAQWSYVSYLAQSMDPDCATYDWAQDALEQDDIVNYLVDEGLTLEEIAYYEEGY